MALTFSPKASARRSFSCSRIISISCEYECPLPPAPPSPLWSLSLKRKPGASSPNSELRAPKSLPPSLHRMRCVVGSSERPTKRYYKRTDDCLGYSCCVACSSSSGYTTRRVSRTSARARQEEVRANKIRINRAEGRLSFDRGARDGCQQRSKERWLPRAREGGRESEGSLRRRERRRGGHGEKDSNKQRDRRSCRFLFFFIASLATHKHIARSKNGSNPRAECMFVFYRDLSIYLSIYLSNHLSIYLS